MPAFQGTWALYVPGQWNYLGDGYCGHTKRAVGNRGELHVSVAVAFISGPVCDVHCWAWMQRRASISEGLEPARAIPLGAPRAGLRI